MKKLYLKVKQNTKKEIIPHLEVEVELVEKGRYGRCKITPVTGVGEIWVTDKSLIIK